MTGSTIVVCPHCDALNRIPAGKPAREGKCGTCSNLLFDGHPVALDRRRFDRHVEKSEVPVLVDFWAAWCGPCRMMAPVFEAAAHELEPSLRFAKVDSDAEPIISSRYGIRSIPTMILFKGGREAARVSGALSAGQLRQWIAAHV